jgi:hypothetical protein
LACLGKVDKTYSAAAAASSLNGEIADYSVRLESGHEPARPGLAFSRM